MGPMFESGYNDMFVKQLRHSPDGSHYSLFSIKGGMAALRCIFPEGKANELNLCLFSTSGVHGTYNTLEDIEQSLTLYPDGVTGDDYPDDYHFPEVTVVIMHPRTCCLRYGNIPVTLADIPWLKALRASSWVAVQEIGAESIQSPDKSQEQSGGVDPETVRSCSPNTVAEAK